jgi:hypothetical protein
MPIAMLTIIIPFMHTQRCVCAQDGRNDLPCFIHPPFLELELLNRDGFLPMVEMILDGAVAGCDWKLLKLENQIIASRNIGLAPDITHIARQSANEEGADEVHRKCHRSMPALMLATLELRRVGHPPGPCNLAYKADRVPHGEISTLRVRILDKAQVNH